MMLHLFASAAEMTGQRSISVPASLATVGELRCWLSERYPQGAELWRKCLIAVNQAYAEEDTRLDQAEVAIIPPVSGG